MIDSTGNERVSWIPFEWVAVFFFFIAIGVTLGWMFDRDRQATTISRLQRKIAKMEDGTLDESFVRSPDADASKSNTDVSLTEASHSRLFAAKPNLETLPSEKAEASSSKSVRPDPIIRNPSIRRNVPKINIDEYVDAIKAVESIAELESLGFEASNIHGLIRPLLQISMDRKHSKMAKAALRIITSPKHCSNEVVAELLDVIDVYRYSSDDKSAATCKAAFSCLVNIDPQNEMNLGKLDAIMNDDLSPWSAYACISLKLLEPQTSISRRFSELLTSRFETNRLVVARKLLNYVRLDEAAELLAAAKQIETSDEVKTAIDASLRQIDKRASNSNGTRKTF